MVDPVLIAAGMAAAWGIPARANGADVEYADVTIPIGEFAMPAYRAMPRGDGLFPAVLVVHHHFEVTADVKDACRALALRGYVAVAPQFFSRFIDPSVVNNNARQEAIGRNLERQLSDEQVLADCDAVIDWIEKECKGDPKRLGVWGFGWGGRTGWMLAAHSSRVKALVAWCPELWSRPATRGSQAKWPIDVAGDLKSPVLAFVGANDPNMSPAFAEKLKVKLAESSKEFEFVVYPEARHLFYAHRGPSFYRKADADDSFSRAFAWLEQHGVSEKSKK